MTEIVQQYDFKKIPIDSNGQLIKGHFRLKSPASLVKISYPKMGKTLAMVNVPKILICDAHREVEDFPFCNNYIKQATYTGKHKFHKVSSGAYIPAGIFETVTDLKVANRMAEYWKLKNMLDERRSAEEKASIFSDLIALINDMLFPITAWDTVTHMQDLNIDAALGRYNSQFDDPDKRRDDIRLVDRWGGVKYIRNNFAGIKLFIESYASPFQIWSAHIKERKAIYEKGHEEISAVDMALDGIMSTTFTAAASAVGILYRKEDGVYLDFKKRDETDLGSRCSHLGERVIKIADTLLDNESIPKTYWKEIYPELNFN